MRFGVPVPVYLYQWWADDSGPLWAVTHTSASMVSRASLEIRCWLQGEDLVGAGEALQSH